MKIATKFEGEPELTISEVSPEDARDFRELEYQTWKATYVNGDTNITLDDIDWLFNERKHTFSEESIQKFAGELAQMKEGQKAIAVKDDKKIIGVAWLITAIDRNEIGSMYIHHEYQSRGIGKKLWHFAQNFFNPNNPTEVTVNKENTQAISYYESLGFIKKGVVETELIFPSGAKYEEVKMVRPPDNQ